MLIPAAETYVIHEGNVDRVHARVVLQGANLAVTSGAESVPNQKGILSAPDVVVNAGGVICAAVEYRGDTRAQAFADIAERIPANTSDMLERVSSTPAATWWQPCGHGDGSSQAVRGAGVPATV